MNILQISAPKTGSYWLYTVLGKILEKKSIHINSFIKKQPEYQQLKKYELSFRGQAGVDMIDIQDEGCFYRVSSVLKKPILDLQDYAASATLAWTHSTYCRNTPEVFRLFEKKVCIIRDPRDRALSASKFAFTKYMQEFYRTTYTDPESFLEHEYERLLKQWVWFYGNYLLQRERLGIHFVCYERLLDDFAPELISLLDYLELELSSEEVEQIRRAVSFARMKDTSPGHLQKGQNRKWVRELSAEQQELAVDLAGDLMHMFGYPLSPENTDLPQVPDSFDTPRLEKILGGINWKDLF